MNRTIKFRGKRSDNGEWVYGSLLRFNGGKIVCIMPDQPHETKADWHFYEVEPATVGLYGEREDKNGLGIYEGDICQEVTEKYISIYKVVWHRCQLVFQSPSKNINLSVWTQFTEVKVIGNIHDNPKLWPKKSSK